MPTLDFKGKTFVLNHHLSVPYNQLIQKKDLSLTDKVSLHDNLIIHGDNLLALKALLPTYAGKIKCIYIDPPYNTGNGEDSSWVYNDNVNSPMIREWLGKVINKDDLTRHDKWLCMMMPRLKLLKELLKEDGIIFISIDDNEIYHLRMLMNEIFGEEKFVEQIIWKNKYGAAAKTVGFISIHEYILAYSKNPIKNIEGTLSESEIKKYRKKDSKYDIKGPYRTQPLQTKSLGDRPNLIYSIEYKGKEIWPNKQWVWSKDRMIEAIKNDEVVFLEKNGKYSIEAKKYLYDENKNIRKGKPLSIFNGPFTQEGTEEIRELMAKDIFKFPKPSKLIKELIKLSINNNYEKDYIVLDSFAGSGTTAHAVLDLNIEDGGSRKFILVECEDYANEITAERVRQVIKGVKTAKDDKLKKGLGGTFSYFELGKAIEMESILKGKNLPTYTEFARYLFYTSTGEEFDESKVNEKSNCIGTSKNYDVFLFYKPDLEYLKSTALNIDIAKNLKTPNNKSNKKRIVFAPAKYLDNNTLNDLNIEFCQLPYEIYRLKG